MKYRQAARWTGRKHERPVSVVCLGLGRNKIDRSAAKNLVKINQIGQPLALDLDCVLLIGVKLPLGVKNAQETVDP